MTDASAQAEQPNEETQKATEAAREKKIELFEKFFCLMDSPNDNEAETAFRMARKALPNIDMTFAGILSMLGGNQDADSAALQKAVDQYQAANDELKLAESVLLEENSRLNLLLRHFRDSKVQAQGLNVESFKQIINDRIGAFENAHEDLMALQLPENAEDLENLYKMRVGEGLALEEGLGGDAGLWQRLLLWSLQKTAKTDLSDAGVIKLQELVRVQENKITEASQLLNQITELRLQGQDIAEKLALIVSESAPKALYDQAMEALKQAQLQLGDSKDIKSLQDQNKVLQAENEQLVKRVADLVEQVMAGAPATPANDDAPQMPKQSAAGHILKNAEEQLRLKETEIYDLQRKLAGVVAGGILSADDIKLITTLDKSLPMLTQVADTLSQSLEKLAEVEKKKESRLKRMFGRKARKEKKDVDKAGDDLRALLSEVKGTTTLVKKLTETFNDKVDERKKELVAAIDEHVGRMESAQASRYNAAKNSFESEFKKIEHDYRLKLDEMKTNVDGMEKLWEDRQQTEKKYKKKAALVVADANSSDEARQAQKLVAKEYFFAALMEKDTVKMDFFLSKGAGINAKNAEGNTPLVVAALMADHDMVDFIMSKGARLYKKVSKFGNKTVFELVEQSQLKPQDKSAMLTKLLSYMPDAPAAPKAQDTPAVMEAQRTAAGRVLLDAINRMDQQAIEACLQKGADINAKNADGNTALFLAVKAERLPVVETLLSYYPDLFIENQNKQTVFTHMSAWNHTELRGQITAKILEAMPDRPRAPRPEITPEAQQAIVDAQLHNAVYAQDTARVDMCLQKGANIDSVNGNGWTPLMYAVYSRNCLDMTDFILDKSPDLLVKHGKSDKNIFEMLEDASIKIDGESNSPQWYANARVMLKAKLLAKLPNAAPPPKKPGPSV